MPGTKKKPTIGIVLCSDTDEDIARYSVLHGNEQLFASKYKLYLPTEEELRAEIETQKAIFYLQQKEKMIVRAGISKGHRGLTVRTQKNHSFYKVQTQNSCIIK